MKTIFQVTQFQFPYAYKFPGQASDEQILFVVRENKILLQARLAGLLLLVLVTVAAGTALTTFLTSMLGAWATLIQIFIVLLAGLFALVGWWWTLSLWRNSIAIVTTKRLIKFIYTTPFNRHVLSLPLEMVVDTGSYTKGLLQAIFKLGTFTARASTASSGLATDDPDRVNKKYFYIENVAVAEDLQHYINKLLNVIHTQSERLSTFRPFIPHLKGERRKEFMSQYPEYWS